MIPPVNSDIEFAGAFKTVRLRELIARLRVAGEALADNYSGHAMDCISAALFIELVADAFEETEFEEPEGSDDDGEPL